MSDYLKFFPNPLLEDIVQGRSLPFVGSGFSMNAVLPNGKSMPDWGTLGKRIAEEMPGHDFSTAIEALSAYGHEFSRAKLIELVSKSLHVSEVRPGPAHEAFSLLPFQKVVTTNFEFLLERSYTSVGKYCLPIIGEEQLALSSAKDVVRLLKIHGDLHHPNSMIVTEQDYDRFINDYPLLSTHLSSLLIENTAIFIGYSLDDPDFRQIWHLIKDRLGSLRRPAYALQVGASSSVVERYQRRGVKVINLPKSSGKSYGEVLQRAFQDLYSYWTSQTLERSTVIEPDSQAEFALPLDSQSRLAFFAGPARNAALYKEFLYPIAEKNGLSPIMAVDVLSSDDNFLAKISALIERSVVIIVDFSVSKSFLEVGNFFLQLRHRKKLIVITDEQAEVPQEFRGLQILTKSSDAVLDNSFLRRFDKALEAVAKDLEGIRLNEATRLLHKKEYRAAVIAAFTQLEFELRRQFAPQQELESRGRISLAQLLRFGGEKEIFTREEQNQLREDLNIRNKMVHADSSITQAEAKRIVDQISSLSNRLKNS